MKFSINGGDLINAFKIMGSAVNDKGANPIMGCIKITAQKEDDEKEMIELATTNGETSIKAVLNGEVLDKGETIVEFATLNAILKGLENETLFFIKEDNQNQIKINYGTSNIALQSINDEFPTYNKKNEKALFNIKSQDFKSLLNLASVAVSTDDSRPILKGVLLETNSEYLKGVSVDGFRLVVNKCDAEILTPNEKVVVPSNGISAVSKLLEQNDNNIQVCTTDSLIIFKVNEYEICSRLLIGDFIEYAKIIPKEYNTSFIVEKGQLLNILQRVFQISKKTGNNMVCFDISKDSLHISANAESGSIDESLQAKVEGTDVSIAFNAKFIIEFLKAVNDNLVKVSLNNPYSPCIITSAEKGTYIYLVLPVRRS